MLKSVELTGMIISRNVYTYCTISHTIVLDYAYSKKDHHTLIKYFQTDSKKVLFVH